MFTYSIFFAPKRGKARQGFSLSLGLFALLCGVALLSGCKGSSTTTGIDPVGPSGLTAAQQKEANALVNNPNSLVFLPGIYYATHIKWTGDLGNKNRVEGPASAIGDGSVKGTYVLIVEALGDSLRLFLKEEGYGLAFPVKTHLGTFASKGLIKSWNSFPGPPVRNSTFKLIDRYSEQEDERVRVVRQSGASQTDFSMSFVLAQERDYQSGKKGRYLIQNNEAQNGFPADLNDTGIFAWMYFARVTPGIVRW